MVEGSVGLKVEQYGVDREPYQRDNCNIGGSWVVPFADVALFGDSLALDCVG